MMTEQMPGLWLIANSRSGSTDEGGIDAVQEKIMALGCSILRFVDLSAEDLPDIGDTPPRMIAALGGDGTANAVIDRYGEDDRVLLLILPGGTMNLLSKKLHGEDATVDDVLERALNGTPDERKMPLLKGPDFTSLVGVIAGPATAWGDVRENIRGGAIGEILETVQNAFAQTFEGHPIRLAGRDGSYSALFIEPQEDGLHAFSVQTEGLGDLAAHGWAWLNRDFLGGPTQALAQGKELTIEGDLTEMGLLVDGERVKGHASVPLSWALCPARFVTTRA